MKLNLLLRVKIFNENLRTICAKLVPQEACVVGTCSYVAVSGLTILCVKLQVLADYTAAVAPHSGLLRYIFAIGVQLIDQCRSGMPGKGMHGSMAISSLSKTAPHPDQTACVLAEDEFTPT